MNYIKKIPPYWQKQFSISTHPFTHLLIQREMLATHTHTAVSYAPLGVLNLVFGTSTLVRQRQSERSLLALFVLLAPDVLIKSSFCLAEGAQRAVWASRAPLSPLDL